MSSGFLGAWIMITAVSLAVYFVSTRIDTGGEKTTRDQRQRVGIVVFGMWLMMSILVSLQDAGHEVSRWEGYGLLIVTGTILFGVLWLRRRWQSRL